MIRRVSRVSMMEAPQLRSTSVSEGPVLYKVAGIRSTYVKIELHLEGMAELHSLVERVRR